jgi:ABC-type bacteriocin/lantibiotic exporter with double-glycine peptidase domain
MDMGFSHWMALESAMHGNRSKRSFTMATLRRIAAFARPHRRALVAFLILSVVSAVLAVATPVLAGWVVDAIIKKGSEARVLFLAGAIAAVAVLDAVVGIAERWQSSRIGEGLILDLRRSVFGHIQRMPVAFFTSSTASAAGWRCGAASRPAPS